jgi:hypothetical protein
MMIESAADDHSSLSVSAVLGAVLGGALNLLPMLAGALVSVPVSHTHIHTHTLSLSLSVCVCVCPNLTPSLTIEYVESRFVLRSPMATGGTSSKPGATEAQNTTFFRPF